MVGIDRYRDGIPELRTAANDARRVGAIGGDSPGYECSQLIDEAPPLPTTKCPLGKK